MNKTDRLHSAMMLLLPLVVAALVLTACGGAKVATGDEQYARGEYFAAMKTYKKVYNKLKKKEQRPQGGEVAFKMGECYRHMNMAANASGAYRNALRYAYPDSMAYLYLAQMLHMEGKYNDAVKNYEAFLEKSPKNLLARDGLRGSRSAAQIKEKGSRYRVSAAKLFNSRRAEFCPMFFDAALDCMYFTSSNEKSQGTVKSDITGMKNCDVYVTRKDEKGQWQRPEPVEGELNSELDEGITAFSPDGSTMYLAKARRELNSNTSVEIYTSQRSEAKWSAPVKLEITADTLSAYSDPAVSPDGNWLYFTSDMPGGQGGKDLWRINLKERVGTLENLGDVINTPGDERFPYVRSDSVIYFASNGHAGLGGLDIFKATMTPSGGWNVENMGWPMNSSYDDFGITFGEGESGFFSSNRNDARGYDHIYSFVKPDLKITISGYVLDRDEEPVPNAVIRIVGDDGSNQKAVGKTDGTFEFNLQRGVNYVMMAGAKGYMNGRQVFRSDDAEEDAEYAVDFILAAMTKPQVIENIFYDFDKATLRPESKAALDTMVTIMKDNPKIVIEMASHTDRWGRDDYNDRLSERRAQSVVDYLIQSGISAERLRPKGYGEKRPKTVTKRIARLYPQFKEGDVLTEEFILTLSEADQAAADQINRRTEFQVISTDFQ